MPRGKGHNPTKKEFGDARIHLEFRFDPATKAEYEGKEPALWKLRNLFNVCV